MAGWGIRKMDGTITALPRGLMPEKMSPEFEPDIARRAGSDQQIYYGDMQPSPELYKLRGQLQADRPTDARLMVHLMKSLLTNAKDLIHIEDEGVGWSLPLSTTAAVKGAVTWTTDKTGRILGLTFSFAVRDWNLVQEVGLMEVWPAYQGTPILDPGATTDLTVDISTYGELRRITASSSLLVKLYDSPQARATDSAQGKIWEGVTDGNGVSVNKKIYSPSGHYYARVSNYSGTKQPFLIQFDHKEYVEQRPGYIVEDISSLGLQYTATAGLDYISVVAQDPSRHYVKVHELTVGTAKFLILVGELTQAEGT